MTRDDIIRMAREAGAHDNGWEVRFVEPRYLERFAALVAAAAKAEEREACARLCDMIADPPVGSGWDDVFESGVEAGANRCADAIRVRNKK